MDRAEVRRWVTFFLCILCAIVIANGASGLIIRLAGITGPFEIVIDFVLYALIFFGVLYVIERVSGIRFFGINPP